MIYERGVLLILGLIICLHQLVQSSENNIISTTLSTENIARSTLSTTEDTAESTLSATEESLSTTEESPLSTTEESPLSTTEESTLKSTTTKSTEQQETQDCVSKYDGRIIMFLLLFTSYLQIMLFIWCHTNIPKVCFMDSDKENFKISGGERESYRRDTQDDVVLRKRSKSPGSSCNKTDLGEELRASIREGFINVDNAINKGKFHKAISEEKYGRNIQREDLSDRDDARSVPIITVESPRGSSVKFYSESDPCPNTNEEAPAVGAKRVITYASVHMSDCSDEAPSFRAPSPSALDIRMFPAEDEPSFEKSSLQHNAEHKDNEVVLRRSVVLAGESPRGSRKSVSSELLPQGQSLPLWKIKASYVQRLDGPETEV